MMGLEVSDWKWPLSFLLIFHWPVEVVRPELGIIGARNLRKPSTEREEVNI